MKGSLNEYGCLFQLFSSQWPPERKDSLLRMACTRNKNKKQKHKSFDHTKLFAPLSIAWIVRAVYGSKLASKWRKEHFDKRTGRGCPVTLPLLQQSNIIFFKCLKQWHFKIKQKLSLIGFSMQCSEQGLLIRMKLSQWYVFISGIKENLLLSFSFIHVGSSLGFGFIWFEMFFICGLSFFSTTSERESSWIKLQL